VCGQDEATPKPSELIFLDGLNEANAEVEHLLFGDQKKKTTEEEETLSTCPS